MKTSSLLLEEIIFTISYRLLWDIVIISLMDELIIGDYKLYFINYISCSISEEKRL